MIYLFILKFVSCQVYKLKALKVRQDGQHVLPVRKVIAGKVKVNYIGTETGQSLIWHTSVTHTTVVQHLQVKQTLNIFF